MTALLALALKLVGTGFLVIATIGVLALRGPVPAHARRDQGRHARRRASCLVGVMLTKGSMDATIIAFLTLIFLIGTMPVPSGPHVLGARPSAYVSRPPLRLQARGQRCRLSVPHSVPPWKVPRRPSASLAAPGAEPGVDHSGTRRTRRRGPRSRRTARSAIPAAVATQLRGGAPSSPGFARRCASAGKIRRPHARSLPAGR